MYTTGMQASWGMVTLVGDRKRHDRRYSLDDSTPRAAGYGPCIAFAIGLRSTVQWYTENHHWWEPLKYPGPGTVVTCVCGAWRRVHEGELAR